MVSAQGRPGQGRGRAGGDEVLEINPEAGRRRIGSGWQGREGSRVVVASPQEGATKVHGLQGSQADHGPDRTAELPAGGCEEPHRGLGQAGAAQDRCQLAAHRHRNRAVPEHMLAASRKARDSRAGRAGPVAVAGRTGAVDSEAPQHLFEGIGAGETPHRMQRGPEAGNSRGDGHGAGGSTERHADISGVSRRALALHVGGEHGSERADWDASRRRREEGTGTRGTRGWVVPAEGAQRGRQVSGGDGGGEEAEGVAGAGGGGRDRGPTDRKATAMWVRMPGGRHWGCGREGRPRTPTAISAGAARVAQRSVWAGWREGHACRSRTAARETQGGQPRGWWGAGWMREPRRPKKARSRRQSIAPRRQRKRARGAHQPGSHGCGLGGGGGGVARRCPSSREPVAACLARV